jgi:hypothetical protein
LSDAEDFLQKALVILSALGLNLFQPPRLTQPIPSKPEMPDSPPEVPPNLMPLLDELKNAVTLPSFPKAVWYWMHVPTIEQRLSAIPMFLEFSLESNGPRAGSGSDWQM